MQAHHCNSFQTRSLVAITVVLGITAFQMAVGIVFSGTALLQEGAHNLIDGFVYALPALSERWARLPERGHTIRGCIISPYMAKGSATILVLSTLGFAIWSIIELTGGTHVENPTLLLAASIVGLLGNAFIKKIFHYEGHVHFDENKEASTRHVIGDVGASVVAVVTYIVLVTVHIDAVDLIGTLIAGAVIAVANLGPARRSPPKRWHRRRSH